jgi:hypothetical protein
MGFWLVSHVLENRAAGFRGEPLRHKSGVGLELRLQRVMRGDEAACQISSRLHICHGKRLLR